MFTTLRSRLWITYALLSLVLLGILAFTLLIYLLVTPERRALQRLELVATTFLTRIESDLSRIPLPRVKDVLVRADELFDVRVLLVGPEGNVLADSRSNSAPPLRPEFRLNRDRVTGRVSDVQGQRWLYYSQLLGEEIRFVVATPQPRQAASLLGIANDRLFPVFLRAGIFALVLALVLSILMARWVSSPLRQMEKAARAVASGEYSPIPLEGPREAQSLARAFNEMAERVHSSQQSQRDFVANVSHELKTPLTSIQGFSQAILDGTAGTPEALEQAASVINSEAGRMHRLVLDLLDLARLDAGTLDFAREPVDLDSLLKSMTEKFALEAQQAQVEFEAEINGLPRIIGDSDRLSQVFTNLVDNALKFTPSGGRVSIHARQVADQVEISFADTGPGIPPDELARVFERFYQLDKSRRGGAGRGAGLGLAIAHEIIQAHYGQITAESQIGQGSVFVVKLPLVRPDDPTLAVRR